MTTADKPRPPNRLALQTSPYLQQHGRNPVDWYPWGAEALQQARASNRPILLSIGYSACHWCHVMAHESFEDEATAAVMNELFVNVKVDREERPDLDRIYQVAHQMLTRRPGGWPLTLFLSPQDQQPFFGGTYFPPVARQGMPGFRDMLARIAQYHREQPAAIAEQNAALAEAFAGLHPPPAEPDDRLDDAPRQQARRALEADFDRQWGGFGGAPKFPHPATLERLLRDWRLTAMGATPDLQALFMATLTLKRVADGGLNDQLGGGFFRYSVDPYWMIPHFEKMLYDNGALLAAFAQSAVATGDEFFARITAETADWLLRDMQLPDGGFCSSLDADSEGHEGQHYLWTPDAARGAVEQDAYALLAARFGLDREPNFEGRAWHLHCFKSVEQVAAEAGLDAAEALRRIDVARAALLANRGQRIAPERDDKVLTSWNAIVIRGLAQAARALRRPELAEAASRALDYIRRHLWRDGRLLATARDGRAQLPAYLDDYALLADAVLELVQARWRPGDLEFACELLEVLLQRFEDPEHGGFFFTADDHEALIHRPKTFADDATPSGNAVAARVLQRMGHLLGEPRYLAAAERVLRAGWPSVRSYPPAHTSMLAALEEYLQPPETLVLRGDAAELERWQRDLDLLYAPARVVLAIPADAHPLPGALAARTPRAQTVAYLCQGERCSEPMESLERLVRKLRLELAAD